jgi:hypothetical protein
MSHIYQPVMIKELLTHGGKASIRDIAAAFLARDESQLEYYEQITKDMPGTCTIYRGYSNTDTYCFGPRAKKCTFSWCYCRISLTRLVLHTQVGR